MDKHSHSNRASLYPPYWVVFRMNLQRLSLGTMAPNIPLPQAASPAELCPSLALCAMVGGHAMATCKHALGWQFCWQKGFPAHESYTRAQELGKPVRGK